MVWLPVPITDLTDWSKALRSVAPRWQP